MIKQKTQSQLKYEAEYERLKHIEVALGVYSLVSSPNLKYEILSIDAEANTALVKTMHSGNEQVKTLYWCKKRLKLNDEKT